MHILPTNKESICSFTFHAQERGVNCWLVQTLGSPKFSGEVCIGQKDLVTVPGLVWLGVLSFASFLFIIGIVLNQQDVYTFILSFAIIWPVGWIAANPIRANLNKLLFSMLALFKIASNFKDKKATVACCKYRLAFILAFPLIAVNLLFVFSCVFVKDFHLSIAGAMLIFNIVRFPQVTLVNQALSIKEEVHYCRFTAGGQIKIFRRVG